MLMEFSVAGGMCNRDGENFYFSIDNEDVLKMLAQSHPQIHKVVRGALCKMFVEKLTMFGDRKVTLEEAHALCHRVG